MNRNIREHERAQLYARFLREFSLMDDERLGLIFEFICSVLILYLIYIGRTPSSFGIPAVGLIMGIDIARTVEAWRRARANIRAERNESQ